MLLVLEIVTLGAKVELMVQGSVDLLRLTVSLQQVAEYTHPSHPQYLLGHTGVLRTMSLTVSRVSAL